MLTIVTGRAGTGKTTYLMERIREDVTARIFQRFCVGK